MYLRRAEGDGQDWCLSSSFMGSYQADLKPQQKAKKRICLSHLFNCFKLQLTPYLAQASDHSEVKEMLQQILLLFGPKSFEHNVLVEIDYKYWNLYKDEQAERSD